MTTFLNDNIPLDRVKAMFKIEDISDKTQKHLTKVYSNVMICALICAAAMWLNAHTVFNGFFMSILVMMGMGYLGYKVSDTNMHETERMGYMWAMAFSLGFHVGPAMHHIVEIDSSIIMNAAAITGIMFASFSAISIFSKRRSYLFLGSLITSIVSCMMIYNFTCWISGYGSSIHSLGYLLLSLFVACIYVIYDTQMIIERCEMYGERDVPKHTMILFLDLFDLFIKIVQVLLELQSQDDKKKKRKN